MHTIRPQAFSNFSIHRTSFFIAPYGHTIDSQVSSFSPFQQEKQLGQRRTRKCIGKNTTFYVLICARKNLYFLTHSGMVWFTYRVCATTSILRALVNFPRSRFIEVIYGFVDFVRLVEFYWITIWQNGCMLKDMIGFQPNSSQHSICCACSIVIRTHTPLHTPQIVGPSSHQLDWTGMEPRRRPWRSCPTCGIF